MTKNIFSRCLAFLLGLMVFCSQVAYATKIDSGVSWLKKQENAQGFFQSPVFGIGGDYQATDESLLTGDIVNKPLKNEVNSRYLLSDENQVTEMLARKILFKVRQGKPTSNDLTELNLRTNAYGGGFSELSNHDVNVIDTAYALIALDSVGKKRGGSIPKSLGYLMKKQNANGSFGLIKGQESVYATALVLNALNLYKTTYNLTQSINKAIEYLNSQYNQKTGWGSTWETAYTLLALYQTTSDNKKYTNQHNYLSGLQQANGSFDDDVYTSALALRALYAYSNQVVVPVSDKSSVFGVILSSKDRQPINDATVELENLITNKVFTSNDSSVANFIFSELTAGKYRIRISAPGYENYTGEFTLPSSKQLDLGKFLLNIKGVGADPGAGAKPTVAIITGKVLFEDKSPAEGVVVSTQVGVKSYIDSTDKNGVYTIEVPAGDVVISIKPAGYHAMQGTAKVKLGETIRFDAVLVKSSKPEPKPTTITVNGLVLDEKNKPIKGVKVTIKSESTETLTKADGSYELGKLTSKSYTFIYSKKGYTDYEVTVYLTPASVIRFSPVILQKEKPVPTSGDVKGVIKFAADGKSAANVIVKITQNKKTYQTSTDTNGRYQFKLPAGAIKLSVTHAGYQALEASGEVVLGSKLIADLWLVKAGQSNPNDGKNITVSGKVIDEASDAIEGVLVSIIGSTDSTTTDKQGLFTFKGLTAGEVGFKFEQPGYQPVSMSAILPKVATVSMSDVVMKKDKDTSNPVTGTYSISGVVTDASTGKPIKGASIAIRRGTNQQIITKGVVSDAKGYYKLENVVAGNVVVLDVSKAGYQTKTLSADKTSNDITLSIALTPVAASSNVSISAQVAVDTYDAYQDVSIYTVVENAGTAARNIILYTKVVDANNTIVHQDKSVVSKTKALNQVDGSMQLKANERFETDTKWQTLNHAAGMYTIYLQVYDAANGALLAESPVTIEITATKKVGLTGKFSPPISTLSAYKPIDLSVDISNSGNVEVPAGNVKVEVRLKKKGYEPKASKDQLEQWKIVDQTKQPIRIVNDSNDNLYVLYAKSDVISKLTSAGTVSEIAIDKGVYRNYDMAINEKNQMIVHYVRIRSNSTHENVFKQIDLSTSKSTVIGKVCDVAANANCYTSSYTDISYLGDELLLNTGSALSSYNIVTKAFSNIFTARSDALSGAKDFVKDSQGTYWLISSNNRILKYTAKGLESAYELTANGLTIDIDSQDNLYVTQSNGDVIKIKPNKTSEIVSNDIKSVTDSWLDEAGNSLWLLQSNLSQIVKVNLSSGSADVVYQTKLRDLTYASALGDKLLVTNSNGTSVQIDSIGGQPLSSTDCSNSNAKYARYKWQTSDGYYYYYSNKLYQCKNNVSSEVSSTALPYLTDIQLQATHTLTAHNYGNYGIQQIDSAGKVSSWWAGGNRAMRVKVGNSNDYWLFGNGLLLHVDENFKLLKKIEGINANDIAISQNGDVYVVVYSWYNGKILKINAVNYNVSEVIAKMSYPHNVIANNSGVYIIDYYQNLYQLNEANKNTTLLAKIGGSPSYRSWATDKNTGQIYTHYWNKIYKYNQSTKKVEEFVVKKSGGFSQVIFADNNLYAKDYSKKLYKIANDGSLSTEATTLTYGHSFTKTYDDKWISLNNNGVMSVVDERNNNAQVFYKTNMTPFRLLQRANGDLLAMYDKGVVVFSGAKNTHIPQILATGSYTDMAEINGELYLSTKRVIYKYNEATKKNEQIAGGYSEVWTIDTDGNNLWIVDYYEDGKIDYFNLTQKVVTKSHYAMNTLTSLAKDNNKLLIASNKRILRHNLTNATDAVLSEANDIKQVLSYKNSYFYHNRQTVYQYGRSSNKETYQFVNSSCGHFDKLLFDGVNRYALLASSQISRYELGQKCQMITQPINRIADAEWRNVNTIDLVTRTAQHYQLNRINKRSLTIAPRAKPITANWRLNKLEASIPFLGYAGRLAYKNKGHFISSNSSPKMMAFSPNNKPVPYDASAIIKNTYQDIAYSRAQDCMYMVNKTSTIQRMCFSKTNNTGGVKEGDVVFSTQVYLPNALAVGGKPLHFDIGKFTPKVAGSYEYVISHEDPRFSGGQASALLYVGATAKGSITLAKSSEKPGDSDNVATVTLYGADNTAISRLDTKGTHLAAQSAAQGRGLAADSLGNMYVSGGSFINKIDTSGKVERFVNMSLTEGMAVDNKDRIYSFYRNDVNRVDANKKIEKVANMGSYVRALYFHAGRMFVLSDKGIYELFYDKKTPDYKLITTLGITAPRALSVDAYGNFYVLNYPNIINKISPDGKSVEFFTKRFGFEHEGVNLVSDCANNVLIAPFGGEDHNGFRYYGEEQWITQINGDTKRSEMVFHGPSFDRDMTDIDVLYYDHVNQQIMIWGDVSNGKVWSFPIICGGLATDLHIISRSDVDVLNMGKPADKIIELPNGRKELIWKLENVDNRGKNIGLDVKFTAMSEGETRPVFEAAYFTFTNTYAPKDIIKVPLDVPSLHVTSKATIQPKTNKSSYPANSDVAIAVAVDNKNDYGLAGYYKLSLLDLNGTVVYQFTDKTVPTIAANKSQSFDMVWNTGLIYAGDYRLQAVLYNNKDQEMARGTTDFKIEITSTKGNAVLDSTISTDKQVYAEKETVYLYEFIKNVTTNAVQAASVATVTVVNPNGKTIKTFDYNVNELYPQSFNRHLELMPSGEAIEGDYVATLVVKDAKNDILTQSKTTFKVVVDLRYYLNGVVVAQHKVIKESEANACLQQEKNQSDNAIKQLSIRHVLMDAKTGKVIQKAKVVVDIKGQGQVEQKEPVKPFTLKPGDYLCVLQAIIPASVKTRSLSMSPRTTKWTTLSYDNFQVRALSLAGVSGYAFVDSNANGVKDSNESGIADITIAVKDSNQSIVATAVSDSSGLYQVVNIRPGSYELDINQAHASLVDMDMVSGKDNKAITLAEGQILTDQNYGFKTKSVSQFASLRLQVWNDLDKDSILDAGESGLSGVTLNLYKSDTNALVRTLTVDANGRFAASDLATGNYYLKVTSMPTGYTISSALAVVAGKTQSNFDSNGQTDIFFVTKGQSVVIGLGMYRQATVVPIPLLNNIWQILLLVLTLMLLSVISIRYRRLVFR